MTMYTGDLKPDLKITLSASDPVNIDDAVSVRIIGERDGEIVIDRAPTSTEVVGDTSIVTMLWVDGDTDVPGTIAFEVEVIWPGPRPQTFRPRNGVTIAPDFDYVPATA